MKAVASEEHADKCVCQLMPIKFVHYGALWSSIHLQLYEHIAQIIFPCVKNMHFDTKNVKMANYTRIYASKPLFSSQTSGHLEKWPPF